MAKRTFWLLSAFFLVACKTRNSGQILRDKNETEAGATPSLALDALLAGVNHQDFSIDALYGRFVGNDAEAKQRVLLVYKSRSPLPATPESPRIIAYSKTGELVISSAASIVEIMEFDKAEARFRFHELRFNEAGTSLQQVHPDAPSCRNCHGLKGRPIWDAFSGWPGVYGSISNTLEIHNPSNQNNPDALGSRGPGNPPDSHPDFKRAEWDRLNRFVWQVEGGYRSRPVYRHFDLGEQDGRANLHFIKLATRNGHFGGLLTELQARQVLAELKRRKTKQDFESFMKSYLYITRLAIIPGGAIPSNAALRILPDSAAMEFEASIAPGGSRHEEFKSLRAGVEEAQLEYANEFYRRQFDIFKTSFGADLTGGSEEKVRSSFKPIQDEHSSLRMDFYARAQLFLRENKVDMKQLSTISMPGAEQVAGPGDERVPRLRADGRGIFRIGTVGNVFEVICSAWAKEQLTNGKPGECYSGSLSGK